MSKIASITPSKNPDVMMFNFEYTKEMKDAGEPVVDGHPVNKKIADLFKVGEDFRVVSIRTL